MSQLGRVGLLLLAVSSSCLLAAGDPPALPETELRQIDKLTGFVPENPGNIWSLTPRQRYHDSVLKISGGGSSGMYGGSGVAVAHTGDKGMIAITNEHVVGGAQVVTVRGWQGTPGRMRVIYRSANLDLAVLYHPGSIWPGALPIASAIPPMGTPIELCGYGGPTADIRTSIGKRVSTSQWAPIQIDTGTVSGDSGGPMIWKTENGPAIVGVNFGGSNHRTIARIQNPGGPWPVIKPASSRVTGPKLIEVLTQVCQPYGMAPQTLQPPRPSPQLQPPAQAPLPQTQAPAPIDYDKLAEAIDVEALRGATGERGPAGRDGDRGPAGPPGIPGVVTQTQVDDAVGQYLAENPPLAAIDYDELARLLLERLPPMSLALIDETGNEIDRDTVPLGGTLRLQFIERSN